MAKRKIERRLTRTSMDAVTGEYVTEHFDAVHNARERLRAALEREMLALPDAAARYRLAAEVEEILGAMRPHTGGEGVVFGRDAQEGE